MSSNATVDREIEALMMQLQDSEHDDLIPVIESIIDKACTAQYAERGRRVPYIVAQKFESPLSKSSRKIHLIPIPAQNPCLISCVLDVSTSNDDRFGM